MPIYKAKRCLRAMRQPAAACDFSGGGCGGVRWRVRRRCGVASAAGACACATRMHTAGVRRWRRVRVRVRRQCGVASAAGAAAGVRVRGRVCVRVRRPGWAPAAGAASAAGGCGWEKAARRRVSAQSSGIGAQAK